MLLHWRLPLEGVLWRPEYHRKAGARLEKQQELLGLTSGWNNHVKQQPGQHWCEAQPEPQQLVGWHLPPRSSPLPHQAPAWPLLCGPSAAFCPPAGARNWTWSTRTDAHLSSQACPLQGPGCPSTQAVPSGVSLTAAAEHETSRSHTLLWPAEEIKSPAVHLVPVTIKLLNLLPLKHSSCRSDACGSCHGGVWGVTLVCPPASAIPLHARPCAQTACRLTPQEDKTKTQRWVSHRLVFLTVGWQGSTPRARQHGASKGHQQLWLVPALAAGEPQPQDWHLTTLISSRVFPVLLLPAVRLGFHQFPQASAHCRKLLGFEQQPRKV